MVMRRIGNRESVRQAPSLAQALLSRQMTSQPAAKTRMAARVSQPRCPAIQTVPVMPRPARESASGNAQQDAQAKIARAAAVTADQPAAAGPVEGLADPSSEVGISWPARSSADEPETSRRDRT